jgi:hypothetical protein
LFVEIPPFLPFVSFVPFVPFLLSRHAGCHCVML